MSTINCSQKKIMNFGSASQSKIDLNQENPSHISKIDPVAIVKFRELSHGPQSKPLVERGVNEDFAAKKKKKEVTKTFQGPSQLERAREKDLTVRITRVTSTPPWLKHVAITMLAVTALAITYGARIYRRDSGTTGNGSTLSFQKDPFAPANSHIGFKLWTAPYYKNRGKNIRQVFDWLRSTPDIPEFKDGTDAEKYRQKWLNNRQCPVNLNDYVDYQKQKKSAPNFNQKDLEALFGESADLTGPETRNLYHLIVNTNRYICSPTNPFCIPKLLPEALRASNLRQLARDYTRIRTNDDTNAALLSKSPWYFQLCVFFLSSKTCLKLRDWFSYGTSNIGDPNYITGKYATNYEDESSRNIYEAAMRTNKEVDALMKLKDINDQGFSGLSGSQSQGGTSNFIRGGSHDPGYNNLNFGFNLV